MEEESFEQASDELSNSSPPNSRPGASSPSGSGDVSVDTVDGTAMRPDAVTNGDVKHLAKNQAVKKVIMGCQGYLIKGFASGDVILKQLACSL